MGEIRRERGSGKWVKVGTGGELGREKDGRNKERVSNLVFYAQSRRERELEMGGGRDRGRVRERERWEK